MQEQPSDMLISESYSMPSKKMAYRLLLTLTFAGVIPFLLLTILLYNHWVAQSKVLAMLFSYAAVILTFLGGIQWGIGIVRLDANTLKFKHLFTLSILPSLAAWLLLLIDFPKLQLIGFIISFVSVLVIDTLLTLKDIMPRWFLLLRFGVSLIVITLLIFCYGPL